MLSYKHSPTQTQVLEKVNRLFIARKLQCLSYDVGTESLNILLKNFITSTASPLFSLICTKAKDLLMSALYRPVQTHTAAPELLQIWNPEHEILRSTRHHFPYDIVHRCQQQIILIQVLQTLQTTKSDCLRLCSTSHDSIYQVTYINANV